MRHKVHTIGNRFGLTQGAPPRHQQKETEIKLGTDLRHPLTNVRGGLNAKIAQNKEIDNEDGIQINMPIGAAADGLDLAFI